MSEDWVQSADGIEVSATCEATEDADRSTYFVRSGASSPRKTERAGTLRMGTSRR